MAARNQPTPLRSQTANAVQTLLRNIGNLWRPAASTKASRAPIMKLPTELLQMIAGYLPISDLAALALSCHRLYHVVGTSWSPLKEEDRSAFLTVLQRDLPSMYLCQTCVRFHSFDQQEGPRKWWLGQANRRCQFKAGWVYNGGHYGLHFYYVQLVMNRHFFGPKHGIPLDALAHTAVNTESCGVVISRACCPRIVKSELFLAATYQFHHKKGVLELLKFIDSHYFRICHHLSTDSLSSISMRRFPELFKDPSEGSSGNTRSDIRRCCDFCLTDYGLVILDQGEKGAKLVVNTWHQLGSGRTPQDPKWINFITLPWNCEPMTYEPGSIRRAHENAELLPSTSDRTIRQRLWRERDSPCDSPGTPSQIDHLACNPRTRR